MNPKLQKIIDTLHHYSMEHMAFHNFGLPEDIVYDALVYAPSYTPYKLGMDQHFQITDLQPSSYCAGYLVEKDGLKIAWIRTSSGACNLLDFLLLCAELRFRKLIFVGSVGSLRPEFDLGDVCTPVWSIAGTLANTYLKPSLRDYVPFEKVFADERYTDSVIALAQRNGHEICKATVFCTDSIVMEYTHLEEIRAFGTDLIEMETAAFYEVSKLLEVPAIALLVVSDNSATGVPLVGRTQEQQQKYHHARKQVLGDMIERIARGEEEGPMDYQALFHHMHPGFFERESIRAIGDAYISEEMLIDLSTFRETDVVIDCPPQITFGMFQGDIAKLKAAVAEVDEDWPQYFDENAPVYCAMDGENIVSFCILSDMGSYGDLKIGGPGCVGTVPAYRRQGIGLKLVQKATGIFQQKGYHISYIHYTGVAQWYAKLGYQPILNWNGNGFV